MASRLNRPLPDLSRCALCLGLSRGPFLAIVSTPATCGHRQMTLGIVKFFTAPEGFGFITPGGGRGLVHISALERVASMA